MGWGRSRTSRPRVIPPTRASSRHYRHADRHNRRRKRQRGLQRTGAGFPRPLSDQRAGTGEPDAGQPAAGGFRRKRQFADFHYLGSVKAPGVPKSRDAARRVRMPRANDWSIGGRASRPGWRRGCDGQRACPLCRAIRRKGSGSDRRRRRRLRIQRRHRLQRRGRWWEPAR